eukprot:UC1_evm3s1839
MLLGSSVLSRACSRRAPSLSCAIGSRSQQLQELISCQKKKTTFVSASSSITAISAVRGGGGGAARAYSGDSAATGGLQRLENSDQNFAAGVIGTGYFAQNHLSSWAELEGVDVTALCDIDSARLQATAANFNVPDSRCFMNASALFDAVGEGKLDLDFVDIVTQVDTHFDLVTQAAAAGLHVICQKPFATSVEQGVEMVEACDRAGVQLMVHENWRWQPAIVALQTELAAGAVGDPYYTQISFRTPYDVYASQPYLAEGDRFIIEDLGIHLLDVARAIMGEPESMYCRTYRGNPRIKGEDMATMVLGYEGGQSCVVDCSYASSEAPDPFPETFIRVEGSEGTIELSRHGFCLSIYRGDRLHSQRTVPPAAERTYHASPVEVIQDSVYNCQQHWIDCMAGREAWPSSTSGRDNLNTLALVDAAYDSASVQQAVPVTSPFV